MTKQVKTASIITKTNLATAFLAAALISFPLGYIYGQSDNATKTETNQPEDSKQMDHGMMDHEDFKLSESDTIPKLSDLQVTADKKSGWNVSFKTENFRFAPENASSAHIDGQGHAHIYVDGKKISRLYSKDYYLDAFAPGEHEIQVVLNTNDHREFHSPDGTAIEQTTKITQD